MLEKGTTKWADLLRFLQWDENNRKDGQLHVTPHSETFSGAHALLGLHSSKLPSKVVRGLLSEEDLVEACVENSSTLEAGVERSALPLVEVGQMKVGLSK